MTMSSETGKALALYMLKRAQSEVSDAWMTGPWQNQGFVMELDRALQALRKAERALGEGDDVVAPKMWAVVDDHDGSVRMFVSKESAEKMKDFLEELYSLLGVESAFVRVLEAKVGE